MRYESLGNICSWDNKAFDMLQVEGTAIGFLSMSDDVNVNLLNECFELAPFHGLRKPHPEDIESADISFTASPPTLKKQGEHRALYTQIKNAVKVSLHH